MKLLEALQDREWEWKEGWKVHCATCGAVHAEGTLNKRHKPKCEYVLLMAFVQQLGLADIDTDKAGDIRAM